MELPRGVGRASRRAQALRAWEVGMSAPGPARALCSENCLLCILIMKKNKRPPLIAAARAGNVNVMKRLLSEGHLPEDSFGNSGWTAVHECVKAKQVDALVTLLGHDKGKKEFLSNLISFDQKTPLSVACSDKKPSFEIISILLKAKANPNPVLNLKNTCFSKKAFMPLHCACSIGDRALELVKLLIKHGADVDTKINDRHQTIIHAVCDVRPSSTQHDNLAKYLIKMGDVDRLDSLRTSPLHLACRNGNLKIVQFILGKSKRRVNKMEHYANYTPLIEAVIEGNLKIVKLLIQAGADVNRLGDGHTDAADDDDLPGEVYLPIHSSLAHIEIFKFLLNVTKPIGLLPNQRFYGDPLLPHFPIFVMFYSNEDIFFEVLLQHKFPESLDYLSFSSFRDVITFILNPDDLPRPREIFEKFKLFFKYCRHFEPEAVFENFNSAMSNDELIKHHRFLNILSKMGISWNKAAFYSKKRIIRLLKVSSIETQPEDREIALETRLFLLQPVLSLQQLSRVAARRAFNNFAEDDWSAFKMIRDSSIPLKIKEYLWYQKF